MDIGADFAGATGASAPAQFLQRGLSPLIYDAARDGKGGRGREGRGREGRRKGGTFSPRTLESKSAPMLMEFFDLMSAIDANCKNSL
jgi:hypothetical protein